MPAYVCSTHRSFSRECASKNIKLKRDLHLPCPSSRQFRLAPWRDSAARVRHDLAKTNDSSQRPDAAQPRSVHPGEGFRGGAAEAETAVSERERRRGEGLGRGEREKGREGEREKGTKGAGVSCRSTHSRISLLPLVSACGARCWCLSTRQSRISCQQTSTDSRRATPQQCWKGTPKICITTRFVVGDWEFLAHCTAPTSACSSTQRRQIIIIRCKNETARQRDSETSTAEGALHSALTRRTSPSGPNL